MKKIFFIAISLILTSCSSIDSKKNQSGEYEEGQLINLPKAPIESVTHSPFYNTQKTRISEKNGFIYDFYYGAGGRYIVVITPPSNYVLNFKQAIATLLVDGSGLDPEIISLAIDDKGMFTGIGTTRNGITEFKLSIEIPEGRYSSPIISEFNFKINLIDNSFNQ